MSGRTTRAGRRARTARGGGIAAFLVAVVALVVAACGGPLLANAPAARPALESPTAVPEVVADPQPIVLPRDDGPHARLTEWWYYTGHLAAADGRTFGFEFVVFRAERGGFPVSWASHLAITDETGRRFAYAQRSEVGPQVDRSPRAADGTPTGFALAITGIDPGNAGTFAIPAWTMAGSGGADTLVASLSPAEAAATPLAGGLGLDLRLQAGRPATLHDGDGWVDFGAAGGSYYYSRTRMPATGSLLVDGTRVAVTGTAWFDHQWGDFISVGGGGWDWFALNLDDGTDITLSLVRAADGSHSLVYGTAVDPNGTVRHLAAAAIDVAATGHWTSARSGAAYPAGWHVRIDDGSRPLDLIVTPTLPDQELDTRTTTGVVYWEGSQVVSGTAGGRAVAGRGYVELTGYAVGSAVR